ncbi:MAG: TlyA family RNA methyltransferase [Magnetococcales bacterium]|nr:TlyA family RNA methyltransferase [Magnetococcales bacterium]
MPPPKRQRLDQALLDRGLVADIKEARSLIMTGQVLVAEGRIDKPGHPISLETPIRLKEQKCPWVSRGAFKLLQALDTFKIDPTGWRCLDAGASTGGFVEVLLDRGAAQVTAVDVGYGQLAWKLVQDPRVQLLDRTNIRHLTLEKIQQPVDLVTMDLSFISLTRVLPVVAKLLKPHGRGIALIKPQFEVKKEQVSQGGLVEDPLLHQQAIEKIHQCATEMNLQEQGLTPSPIKGPAGNVEFLFYFGKP